MRRTRMGSICTCAAAAMALTLLAGSPANAQGPSGKRAQVMKTRQELQQVGAKLERIQKAAIKGSKKLEAQRDRLRSMVEAAMKKQGQDPIKGMKQLEALKKKLQSGKLSDAEKKKTLAKLREKGQALQMAQLKAMQDAKVKKASKAFQSKLEAAMVKQDPATKKLLKRYKELSKKLRSLMMSARG